jgi:hypothetical protein
MKKIRTFGWAAISGLVLIILHALTVGNYPIVEIYKIPKEFRVLFSENEYVLIFTLITGMLTFYSLHYFYLMLKTIPKKPLKLSHIYIGNIIKWLTKITIISGLIVLITISITIDLSLPYIYIQILKLVCVPSYLSLIIIKIIFYQSE